MLILIGLELLHFPLEKHIPGPAVEDQVIDDIFNPLSINSYSLVITLLHYIYMHIRICFFCFFLERKAIA